MSASDTRGHCGLSLSVATFGHCGPALAATVFGAEIRGGALRGAAESAAGNNSTSAMADQTVIERQFRVTTSSLRERVRFEANCFQFVSRWRPQSAVSRASLNGSIKIEL